jgi:hypothetical protein
MIPWPESGGHGSVATSVAHTISAGRVFIRSLLAAA